MSHGMEVGLSPGDFLFDGDPAPLPKKGEAPQFSAHVCCGQIAAWIKMPLGTEVGLGSDYVVSWGPSSPLSKKGAEPHLLPNFRPMSFVVKRLDESRWHLAWR